MQGVRTCRLADNDKTSHKGHRTALRCCRCPFLFVKYRMQQVVYHDEIIMTKKEALQIVFSCAASYKENLAGRSLLFVTTDKHKTVRCLEVSFDGSNFLHMTGFKLNKKEISANNFFSMCCDKRLSESDFEFAADGTTEMKMRVLPGLVQKHLSAKMVGDYNLSQPKLYTDKLAGSVGACMGFVRNGGKGRFVPNTVLEGDIRSMVKGSADRIVITYRKQRGDALYTEIVYTAKKIDWTALTLPEEYQYLPLP